MGVQQLHTLVRQGYQKCNIPTAVDDRLQRYIFIIDLKVLLRRNFHFFFRTVFLKNVKYRCKLREITMNRVRLNIFCLDITLQKSQKLVRHCFVRKPRVRCILHQRVCFVTSSNQPSSHLLQKYTESVWIHLVYRRITSPNKVLI